MNDITGKELAIGDKVVSIESVNYAVKLYKGIVTAFTKQKVRIRPVDENWVCSDIEWDDCLKSPNNVAKVE